VRSRPASSGRRQLDPVAGVLHPLLQPTSTHVERLVSPSISEGGLDLRRHRAAALTSG
jgi:hypothetical protein